MQSIGDLQAMEKRVHKDCDALITRLRELSERPHATIEAGISILSSIRDDR